jgi:hypothetical protein
MAISRKAAGALALPIMAAALTGEAAGQDEDYRTIVTIMRACSTIQDITARVTCYDQNIAVSAAPAKGATVPEPSQPNPAARSGFGSDSLPQPRSPTQSRSDQIDAQVKQSAMREPGVYVLTLEDGGEWQFVDAAPAAYEVPRAGSTVRIVQGSLGGFLMRYAEQPSIRVRRIR